MTSRVAFLTADTVGPAMAGPAIRAVELAGALRTAGFETSVVAPRANGPISSGVEVVEAATEAELRQVLADVDAVVGFSGALAELGWIFDLGLPVVVDAYDPGLLETLERFRGTPVNEQRTWVGDAGRHLCDPLAHADLVLVANERQRHYVLGLLTAAGRINGRTWAEDPTLRSLCAIVPFGIPSQPPVADAEVALRRGGPLVGPGAVVALWGGGLYDWLDPLLLVEGVHRCADERVVGVFLAGPHPTPSVGRLPLVDRVRRRADELGLLGERIVLVEEWVPYHERGAWLAASDIGVSLHGDHLETTFAFRTRILDYLWASLPVLCSDGDHFAEVVARSDLGVVVPPADADAVAEALATLAGAAPATRAARRRRSAGVAAELTWDRVAEPLVQWAGSLHLAADRRVDAPAAGGRRAAVRRLLGRAGG